MHRVAFKILGNNADAEEVVQETLFKMFRNKTVPDLEDEAIAAKLSAATKTMALDAIIVNLADYALGSTKGGEITHFTDFEIKFNQLESLIETRVSGANTRVYSAIVIEEEVSNP